MPAAGGVAKLRADVPATLEQTDSHATTHRANGTAGRALWVGEPPAERDADGRRIEAVADPYALIVRLTRCGDARAVVLSLEALSEGELAVIATLRRRFAGVEVFVTDVAQRGDLLAAAVGAGVDGLYAGDRPQRFAPAAYAPPPPPPAARPPVAVPEPSTGAVLTSDELRALLGDDDDL